MFLHPSSVWTTVFCPIALLITSLGCGNSTPQFNSDRVYVTRLSLEIGEPVNEEGLSRIETILTRAFGTPDEPQVPLSVPNQLVSVDGIRRAAGPVFSDEMDVHFGLYRKHCVRCHGLTGDGKGPAARLLDPYPRDFRLGKFKFKSTPTGTKPTRQDLSRILRHGIPGTSMPSFRLLKDEEIDALIDYVIYLTARGETERWLMNRLVLEHGNDPACLTVYLSQQEQQSDGGQESLRPSPISSIDGSDQLEQLVVGNYKKWDVSPPVDPQLPLDVIATVVSQKIESDQASSTTLSDSNMAARRESITRGKELFVGPVAGCSRCHGTSGEGGLQVVDYDDWTKAWANTAGVALDDKATFSQFTKAGALKPIPISVRDLRHGVFRGGDRPEDIFRRIVHGIEGTTMPAAALQPEVPGGLSEQDVWDLVNYCISLKNHKGSNPTIASGDSL